MERQKSNAAKLFSYIFEDMTDNLYGIQGEMHRVAIQSQEINFISDINELIDSSKRNGFAYRLVELGVIYLVAHQDPCEKEEFQKMLEEAKLEIPRAFFLNPMKINQLGYYPFSLTITDPENYFDILQGNFVINVFIDFQVISQIAEKHGFSFHENEDLNFPYEFKNKYADLTSFKMSNHFFGRVIFEFVSLNWLLSESFEIFNNSFLDNAHNSGKKCTTF